MLYLMAILSTLEFTSLLGKHQTRFNMFKIILPPKRVKSKVRPYHARYLHTTHWSLSLRPISGSRLWPRKWRISCLISYSSWCKHATNKFLIDSSASCWSQDVQVFENWFLREGQEKSPCNDRSRLWLRTKLKSCSRWLQSKKNLWCVFDEIFCSGTFVTFWCNVCNIFDMNHMLTHARTEKLHNSCFGNTFKYQVTKWWLKNQLTSMWSNNKVADFFPEIKIKKKKKKVSLSVEWALSL